MADKEILVVDRNILFGKDYFEGISENGKIDYMSRIQLNKKWMERSIAEKDPTHKQPIAYAIIANPKTKQIFAYQRAKKDKDYGEKRLQGKWAIGVGGHIERKDSNSDNIVLESMIREIKEEVSIAGSLEPKILGYINYDTDEVGKVHFGVLYLIKTNAIDIFPIDAEIENGSMKPLSGLEKMFANPNIEVENWSKLALPVLKKAL